MPYRPIDAVLCALALTLAPASGGLVHADEFEHRELGATLSVPYRAPAALASGARTFHLAFDYPRIEHSQDIAWRVDLNAPDGSLVKRWQGVARLHRRDVVIPIRWAGRPSTSALPDGIYRVRLTAAASPARRSRPRDRDSARLLERALAGAGEGVIEQGWNMQLGSVRAPTMARMTALPMAGRVRAGAVPADDPALPFTIYLGNLHSQTNHSDGGGDVHDCSSSHKPQTAPFGPADAFHFARGRGLDILVASEHNHMYDGSNGTKADATPAAAKALYRGGLAEAGRFNVEHPAFLAIYGMEWGVINKGGHLNIFNSPELLGWERNGAGQLLADSFTDKNDYAALYTLMRERGLVGQFNHPSTRGQFHAGGKALGHTDDGEHVMVLCEVMNSMAFSSNMSESEPRRSTYEQACGKALEAGYRVAFSSNQDNHCANWGAAYTNRTGILIPNATPLSLESFIDALRARRVYATMDKDSQLILKANGRLMGERFDNSGPLTIEAGFANSQGRGAALVQIFEGVPKRNGGVTLLSETATTTITPAPGEHFYYARVTQDDGKMLWSAPVWVTQRAQ